MPEGTKPRSRSPLLAGKDDLGAFYAASQQFFGVTPTAFKSGDASTAITFTTGTCALGAVLVASTPVGVCAVFMGDDTVSLERDLAARFPKAGLRRGGPASDELLARIVAHIEQPGSPPALPLDIRGTVFQHKVWRALRGIPAGATLTYAELAQHIGQPSAVRAVARACGANPVAVVIPCHRVTAKDGTLSGYRWGVERKRQLLERERAVPKSKK